MAPGGTPSEGPGASGHCSRVARSARASASGAPAPPACVAWRATPRPVCVDIAWRGAPGGALPPGIIFIPGCGSLINTDDAKVWRCSVHYSHDARRR